jgi:hypothetical protein
LKLLLGCTPEEMQRVQFFHNSSDFLAGMLIKRTKSK